jgi:hypothetical protein
MAKAMEGVIERVESRDQKILSQTDTPEKVQEVLVSVKDSIVNGLQTTLEGAVVKLVKELKEETVAEEPDPMLVNLTEAIENWTVPLLKIRKCKNYKFKNLPNLRNQYFKLSIKLPLKL